jgi:peptidoglycan hydrolase-like protein with peptidoglycan-binding domain
VNSPSVPPRRAPRRAPLRRGAKEAIIAVVALPVLLATGLYVGGLLADSGSPALHPLTAAAGSSGTPAPVVTVKAPAPTPVVTVKAPAPTPVVTVKAPAPVVTVKAPAPTPVVTVKAPAPSAPAPLVTVRPHSPTTAAATPMPFPPSGDTAPAGPVSGPVAPSVPPAGPAVILGRGAVGAPVAAWQRQMARRGWRIVTDGVFGPQSQRVALRFQREKGLQVDGLVGRETWSAAWQRPITP